MKKMFYLMAFLLVSCGGEKVKYYPVTEESFNRFVNQKNLPAQPNLSLDKSIINTSYPIEIALYKDNKFYYDLPNLGDGIGTWEFKDGLLELKAHRDIFDMKIDVKALDESASKLGINFIDRHGFNSIKMSNNNIE